MAYYLYSDQSQPPKQQFSHLQSDAYIPIRQHTNLQVTSDADTRKCSVLAFFLLKICQFLILSCCLVVILGTLNLTAKYFDCNIIDVEDAISDGVKCNSDNPGFNIFFAINRMLGTSITILVVIYISSNASTNAIGFADSIGSEKFTAIANFFLYGHVFGKNLLLLFFFTIFSSTFIFFDGKNATHMPVEIPGYVLSNITLCVTSTIYILFFTLYEACFHRCASLSEFSEVNNTDETIEFETFIKPAGDSDNSDAEIVNIIYGIIYIFYVGAMSFAIIFISTKTLSNFDDYEPLKKLVIIFKLVLSVAGLIKHIMFAVRMCTTGRKLRQTLFQAMFIFFESTYLLEIFDDNTFTLGVVIAPIASVGIVLVYSFFYVIYTGEFKQYLKSAWAGVKNVLCGDEYVVIVVTMATCLFSTLLFLQLTLELTTFGGTTTKDSFIIKLCDSLISNQEVTDNLMTFYPTKSLVKYTAIVSQSINLESNITILLIGMVAIFGWRYVGTVKDFTKVVLIVAIYQSFISFRDDSTKIELLSNIELGYAELEPTTGFKDGTLASKCCSYIFLWFLVAASCTESENSENVDSSVQPHASNSHNSLEFIRPKSSEKWRKCWQTFIEIIPRLTMKLFFSIVLLILVIKSFEGDWVTSKPQKFDFESESEAFPLEIENTDVQTTSPELYAFVDDLSYYGNKLDIIAKDAAVEENLLFEPFESVKQKLAFNIPHLITIVYVIANSFEVFNERIELFLVGFLIFVNGVNFVYLNSYFLLLFVITRQFPYFAMDVFIDRGLFYFIMASLVTFVTLVTELVDHFAPFGTPIDNK